MADLVEFRTEEMILELEQLVRLRILNEGEIRNIIKSRKLYQTKIQKKKKCMENYGRYIQFEMDLLMLVKSRRAKLGLVQKKHDVDMIIANRVNKLYEQAIFRFHDDIHLWLSYMKFCKQVKVFSVCVSNMLVGMLAVHSHKPSLWKLAATWEFEENKSIENACQFLMRGLKHHPNSKILYKEAFRLELIYADMKRKKLDPKETENNKEENAATSCAPSASSSTSFPSHRGPADADPGTSSHGHFAQGHSDATSAARAPGNDESPPPDPVIDCRHAEIIYEVASKKIPDVSFLISFLNIAKDFVFTEKLQARMVKDLLSWFPNDELTWDALARRELEGLHFFMDRPSNAEEECQDSMEVCEEGEPKPDHTPKSETEKIQYMRIRHCFTIYQRGLQHLGTTRMWGLYLNTLIEMNQNVTFLKNWKQKMLLSAFQKAHEESCLQEKYYIHWAGMLAEQKEELSFVLDAATERFSSSIELWEMRLRFHLSEGEEEAAMAVFKLATTSLGPEEASSLSLWKMMIQYYQTKSIAKVKALYLEGVKQGPAVSSVLKQMFLEWLAITKSIGAARQVYHNLCDKPPFCREMHQKMAELECFQPEVQIPRVVKCYELACKQFGKNNTDVWKEYVQFEIKRGDPKKVKEIYLRALKTLDEEHAHNFISEFCEFWVVKSQGVVGD